MGTEGRELNWDDTIQNDSSFVELPEGDYNFTIDHYERGRSQGSSKIPPSNMAIVYFNVHTPEGQEVTIKENFILHSKLEWKLSELFCGVGLKKKGEELRMNWNALPGLTVGQWRIKNAAGPSYGMRKNYRICKSNGRLRKTW